MKKILSVTLAIVLLITCAAALAADAWTCPGCGQTGNTGNFCPECGAARPNEGWTCSICGFAGNTDKFCTNCGTPKDDQAPVETETVSQPIDTPAAASSVQVGDYISFGQYEQDGKTNNGAEAIEWKVLDIQNGKALVISRYAILAAQFNPHSSRESWYNCKLRETLNGKFYNQAFNSSEKNAIQATEVDDSSEQWDPKAMPNSTRVVKNTTDYIFILSYGEMVRYMPTAAERLCRPTKYAVAQGSNSGNGGYCWYWMRNPAYNNNVGAVGWEGELDTCYMNHTYGVARPACWVDLAAIGY